MTGKNEYEVNFSTDAQTDYEEVVAWYESQKVGLGFEFTLRLTEFISVIEDRPHHMHFLLEDARYGKLKYFPYKVYFFLDESTQTITIFAIIHEKRHPEVWKRRLG